MFSNMLLESDKILVIDSDPLNINLLRVILQDAGYQVEMFTLDNEILDNIIGSKPDLIILDIGRHDGGGYEICHKIRENPALANLPVIAIIAMDSADDRSLAFEAGATFVINKPFEKRELLSRIRANLISERVKKVEMAINSLPQAIVIASSDWIVLSLSQCAAELLKTQHDSIEGTNFLTVLRQYGLSKPANENSPCALSFNTHAPQLQGEHNPVKDNSGQLILRVLVLSDHLPQVMWQ